MRTLLPLALLALVACDSKDGPDDTDTAGDDSDAAGADTGSGGGTDSGTDTGSGGGTDSGGDSGDSGVAVDLDTIGVEGIWSGKMDATLWTTGAGPAGAINRMRTCSTGSITFVIDLDASPNLQVQSYACTEIGVPDLTIEADIPRDGMNRVAWTPGQGNFGIPAEMGASQFGTEKATINMTFTDDDADDKIDTISASFNRAIVSLVGVPGSGTWAQNEIAVFLTDVVKTGPLP